MRHLFRDKFDRGSQSYFLYNHSVGNEGPYDRIYSKGLTLNDYNKEREQP